jgi:hypothetical protein
MKKIPLRKIVMESDWISFFQGEKEIAGFGFVPEAEDYRELQNKWLSGLGIRELRKAIRAITA